MMARLSQIIEAGRDAAHADYLAAKTGVERLKALRQINFWRAAKAELEAGRAAA